MNYIWELMLQADREGIPREELNFVNALAPSPYLEVSFENLNIDSNVFTNIEEQKVEVNPLYRFGNELGRLFDRNVEGFEQTREMFFDIFLHYVAQLDLREGLSRHDYYIRFLNRDIKNNEYGKQASEDYFLFSDQERKQICMYLLRLMKTGNYLHCFRGAVKAIYPQSLVYENNDMAYELLVYLGVAETEEEIRRIRLIRDLYLPIQETIHIFYEHHFGIIGVDETMYMDEMMIF